MGNNDYRIGKHILDCAHKIKLDLNSQFEKVELTGLQARILGFLMRNLYEGQDIYQKDIEAEFKISRSSVTSVLNNMERGDFIERKSVERDARLKKITLTEKALAYGEANKKILDDFEKMLGESLTDEEKAQLNTLLNKVIGYSLEE